MTSSTLWESCVVSGKDAIFDESSAWTARLMSQASLAVSKIDDANV